jgi:hypothetical protein
MQQRAAASSADQHGTAQLWIEPLLDGANTVSGNNPQPADAPAWGEAKLLASAESSHHHIFGG